MVSVFTVSDPDGQVRSEAVTRVQDAGISSGSSTEILSFLGRGVFDLTFEESEEYICLGWFFYSDRFYKKK